MTTPNDMTVFNERSNKLVSLAKTSADQGVLYKLDLVASVFINDRQYFQVFRRYNSVYEFVIEDTNGDIYLHKDYILRESIRTILCLSPQRAQNMYVTDLFSYKMNAPVTDGSLNDVIHMRWSQIQTKYYAIQVNLAGVFEEPNIGFNIPTNYEPLSTYPSHNLYQQDVYKTPDRKPVMNVVCLNAPERPSTNSRMNQELNNEDYEAANTLLTLIIPKTDTTEFYQSASDMPEMSMRMSYNRPRSVFYDYYYEMDTQSESESETTVTEDTEETETEYILLRNGKQVYRN